MAVCVIRTEIRNATADLCRWWIIWKRTNMENAMDSTTIDQQCWAGQKKMSMNFLCLLYYDGDSYSITVSIICHHDYGNNFFSANPDLIIRWWWCLTYSLWHQVTSEKRDCTLVYKEFYWFGCFLNFEQTNWTVKMPFSMPIDHFALIYERVFVNMNFGRRLYSTAARITSYYPKP